MENGLVGTDGDGGSCVTRAGCPLGVLTHGVYLSTAMSKVVSQPLVELGTKSPCKCPLLCTRFCLIASFFTFVNVWFGSLDLHL